jgi:hypothetical protein
MVEAYSGNSEIADRCEDEHGVLVDAVAVPQYWSEVDNQCWPPSDTMSTVEEAVRQDPPNIADPRFGKFDAGDLEGRRSHRPGQ